MDRIHENVTQFRDRYYERFEGLVNQGFEQYMANEFADLRAELKRLDRLISSDPERARDLSFEVGRQLSQLSGLARAARHEFKARDRQQRKELAEMRHQATTSLAQFIHEMISQIKDPVELDFAYDEVKSIQQAFQGRTIEAEELSNLKNTLNSQFSELRKSAQARALAWKQEKTRATSMEATETLLDMFKEQATADASQSPKALEEMMANLESVRDQISSSSSHEEIGNKIFELAKTADNSVTDEKCRRMAVRSIMDSLEKSGFVVSKPRRGSSEIDEVVILARKPAGAEATFRITADGSMIYKFDHYEGMQCKDDIDKVLPMLQEIYGINLSNERVLWKNPERISRSAKPLDDNKGHKNG